MIDLGRFRIRAIDVRNLIVEEYKEIKAKDKSRRYEWVNILSYYNSLEQSLKALKDYLILDFIGDKDKNIEIDELMRFIDTLSSKTINCSIKPKNIDED